MGPFSESDRNSLESNPAVLKVTETNVSYKPNFKIKAVEEYLRGIPPKKIFSKAGIDLSLFNPDYAKKTLHRWRKIYDKSGKKGLESDGRGSKASGRPKAIKFKTLEEENAYLRAEIDFLKKLHALARKDEKKKNSY
jgi:transposase-like protein